MAQADAKAQAGMQEAMQTISGMLSRLLTKRFGNLPADVAGQIKNASKEQIEIWFDRVIDAATLDEVFQDPPIDMHAGKSTPDFPAHAKPP